jgi:hypothetical protein
MTPLYLLIIVFPKFDPLTASGMALCLTLVPEYQKLFSLLRLCESNLAYTETKPTLAYAETKRN